VTLLSGVLDGVPADITLFFETSDGYVIPLHVTRPNANGSGRENFVLDYAEDEHCRVEVVSIDAWANGDGGWDWNNISVGQHIRLHPKLEEAELVRELVRQRVLRQAAIEAHRSDMLTIEDQNDVVVIAEHTDVDQPEDENEEPQDPFMPILALAWDQYDINQFNEATLSDMRGLLVDEPLHDHFQGMWQTRSTCSITLADDEEKLKLSVWLDQLEETGAVQS